jgi:creatinine amidohydrolase
MSGRGVWLEDLTWPEAKARFDEGAAVVIPIGAASKAHGPHLPLKTDAVTARALAQGVIERLDVVAAPVVGFGFYPAFTSFAGSQHLSAATFKALLGELLGNLRGHGVSRIVLLNTGVSTEKPIDEVAGGATDVLVLHIRGLGAAADRLLDAPEGGHADERETSVMLALEPRSVRMDRLALTDLLRKPAPPAIRRGRAPSRASASWRHGWTTWWRRSAGAGPPLRAFAIPHSAS